MRPVLGRHAVATRPQSIDSERSRCGGPAALSQRWCGLRIAIGCFCLNVQCQMCQEFIFFACRVSTEWNTFRVPEGTHLGLRCSVQLLASGATLGSSVSPGSYSQAANQTTGRTPWPVEPRGKSGQVSEEKETRFLEEDE